MSKAFFQSDTTVVLQWGDMLPYLARRVDQFGWVGKSGSSKAPTVEQAALRPQRRRQVVGGGAVQAKDVRQSLVDCAEHAQVRQGHGLARRIFGLH